MEPPGSDPAADGARRWPIGEGAVLPAVAFGACLAAAYVVLVMPEEIVAGQTDSVVCGLGEDDLPWLRGFAVVAATGFAVFAAGWAILASRAMASVSAATRYRAALLAGVAPLLLLVATVVQERELLSVVVATAGWVALALGVVVVRNRPRSPGPLVGPWPAMVVVGLCGFLLIRGCLGMMVQTICIN